MRECHGLVDALVAYINHALDVGKCEDKVSCGLRPGGARRCARPDQSPPSAERGERRVRAEEPLLPPVRRDAAVGPAAARGPGPQGRGRGATRRGGGLLHAAESAASRGGRRPGRAGAGASSARLTLCTLPPSCPSRPTRSPSPRSPRTPRARSGCGAPRSWACTTACSSAVSSTGTRRRQPLARCRTSPPATAG